MVDRMPSLDETANLLKFVEEYPTAHQVHGYRSILEQISKDYQLPFSNIDAMLKELQQFMFTGVGARIVNHLESHPQGEVPNPDFENIQKWLTTSISATILRTFLIGLEYSRRYLAEGQADQINSAIEELTKAFEEPADE